MLTHFNVSQKRYNFKVAEKFEIGDLAEQIDFQEYTRCLCQIFAQFSQFMLSHHLMARYHHDYPKNEELQEIMSESENREMSRQLLNDRAALSQFMQRLICEFLTATSKAFLALSVTEVFDVFRLTNKFLEISFEFSSPKKSDLFDCALSLGQRYFRSMLQSQFDDIKDLLESEQWNRMPLPDHFELSEHKELIQHLGKRRHLRIFNRYFDGKLEGFKRGDQFSKLISDGNPFLREKFGRESQKPGFHDRE